MRAIAKSRLGTLLTPEERNIMFVYMDKLQSFVLGDQGVFSRASHLNTQRTRYQTEETTVDIDENVRIVDGPEEEEKMRKREEKKAKKISIDKHEKYKLLSPALRKEKAKAGMDEEVLNFHQDYKERFEAALEYYGVTNIRDLPEEKKAEFFAVVDEAAKMAKKDHDGDGKIETSTAEYMGSRDKAIKKAMKKEEVEVEEGYYKDKDTNKKEDERLAKKPAIKLKGFGPDAAKGNMSNPAARAALMKKEETELDEAMTPEFKAKRLDMIRQAHDRVLTGKTRDAAAAKKAAKTAMKQKGAQKGMAPTKKDELDEQIQQLRKMIKENNNKSEAYKLLAKILNNAETLGEQ